MEAAGHVYMAIDLKSFYASVECIERNLDPLTTNLVVADTSKTEKTICLAVSPSLKQYGISGRARLFEVIQKVKEVNFQRKRAINDRNFIDKSYFDSQLKKNPYLELSYIAASPRMALYMEYSTRIYNIYLKYVSPADLHVYSIDEVFIDATSYLKASRKTPGEFAKMIILDILETIGITATAGIGTNLYLAKVAMDIVAKHVKADEDGVRIAYLDEMRYRKYLWHHQPITDFWRIGRGYEKKLKKIGLFTMGDIAKCSVGSEDEYYNEDLLYSIFGINAELLIDHAWGCEPCTMQHIKAYKPENNSIGIGQVLSSPYSFEKGKLILKEMLDALALSLVDKKLVTNQIIITIGYDIENVTTGSLYREEIITDRYGRKIPKHAHGTINLDSYTASAKLIILAVLKWYEEHVKRFLTIRRFNISANHIIDESSIKIKPTIQQMDLFTDYDQQKKDEEKQRRDLEKEKRLQKTTLELKKKYGKNAVLKGMNLAEGATGRERNKTIGGHKA